MTLRVSGKNIDLGDALRARIGGRIQDAVEKYFDGGWSGHVTVGPEGGGYRAECVLHLDSGVMLQAHGEAQDPTLSCDSVVEHIEKRLRRYKRRLKGHRPNGRGAATEPLQFVTDTVLSAPDIESDEDESWNPAVIAEATSSLATMSVRDAVMQLDLSGAPVLVFRHPNHGHVNMVYRRADGHIGWIDPPITAGKDGH